MTLTAEEGFARESINLGDLFIGHGVGRSYDPLKGYWLAPRFMFASMIMGFAKLDFRPLSIFRSMNELVDSNLR
jgi:hypothetical protein